MAASRGGHHASWGVDGGSDAGTAVVRDGSVAVAVLVAGDHVLDAVRSLALSMKLTDVSLLGAIGGGWQTGDANRRRVNDGHDDP